jgi:hypothetical protein
MVLVFDTEDWIGSRNSLKLAMQFFKAHHETCGPADAIISFTKIPMIKAIREVANAVENGKLNSSLRDCKKYTEDHWIDWL